MKSKTLIGSGLLVIISLLGSLVGCDRAAPVPPPYSVSTYRTPDSVERQGVTYVNFQGTVKSETGAGISGIRIRVLTPRHESRSLTSDSGAFYADALFAKNEEVEFHFSAPSLDWTEHLRAVPPGTDTVSLHFVVDHLNRVRLSALEY